MKKYEAYKNSEFEWLGKVPIEWENCKLSHAFNKIGSGTTPESGNPIYHEGGTINWLNTGDLNNGILDSSAKKITKKALEDYLPNETIYRPKMGFGAPLRHWVRNDWRELIDDLVSDRRFRERGFFDPIAFEKLVVLDRKGIVDGAYSIYAVLCTELWARQFIDAP